MTQKDKNSENNEDFKNRVDKDHRIQDYTEEEIQEYLDKIRELIRNKRYIISEGDRRS